MNVGSHLAQPRGEHGHDDDKFGHGKLDAYSRGNHPIAACFPQCAEASH